MLTRALRWTVAAVAAFAMAACGSNTAASPSATDLSTAAAATRTVTSTFTGKQVEIPTNPQRVLALWRVGSELADLGVVPVAALEGELLESELGADVYAKVKDVPTVGTYEGVDIQKVIAAKPDLIIGMDNSGLKIDYDELSEVAPTVILKIAEPTDVWDNYPTVADLVAKSTDFETRNAAIDKQLAEVKTKHGDVLGKLQVTAFSGSEDGLWVNTSKSLTYRRLNAAGFGYNPTYTDNPQRFVTALALENLPDLGKQDALLYETAFTGTVPDVTQTVLDAASFKALQATKAGLALPIGSGTVYTLAAAQKQADDIKAAAEKIVAAKG
ncbi:MAG: ABC transporter substrate-binding protein [Micropruina sp.]|uniref:ABC transporter substrate-binding protein n=1 Tax=Micropruina sp. TaxID=2737536 RepID=UPI0039E30728